MSDMRESAGSSSPDVLQVPSTGLQPFLDISPDALVVVNQQGMLVLVNRHLETLFGYSRSELLGQPLDQLLPARFRSTHIDHRKAFFASPRSRAMGVGLDLVGRRKDGSEFPVDISLNPLLLDGQLHVMGAVRDMSLQRQQQREEVRRTERLALQRTVIELAHDAIIVRDPISRVLFWNRGAEELYGWKASEAQGRIIHTLLKTRFPIGLALVDAQLEQLGQWEGELTHTCRNGSQVVVESRQVLLRDEQGVGTILEINRDITQRRKGEQEKTAAHAEILAQRTFLQQLLDALPSSIYVVHGRQARLVLANKAASSIWGAEWPLGQPMEEFLAERDICIEDAQGRAFPVSTWATTRALLEGATVLQHQEVIRQPSGARIPILVNAVPLTSPHWQSLGLSEYLVEQQDVQQTESLALVIHQDVRLLKEAEYIKDEFIGIAAHELRQPLAIFKGTVGTLVLQTARGHGPQLADWQYEMLTELEQATTRLVQLTEDLLDVSRLQAGQLFLQPVSVDLVSLVRRIVARLQKETTRHQFSFTSALDRLEGSVDPQRIEQVLSNLLTNAMKYSPQGGPVRVTLDQPGSGQEVEICIQDEGIGIPQHQQAQIFGRFMRAENAQAAGVSGTGLGLYLCRALVEQHGGRLWFTSREGEGSTFFMCLPLPSH